LGRRLDRPARLDEAARRLEERLPRLTQRGVGLLDQGGAGTLVTCERALRQQVIGRNDAGVGVARNDDRGGDGCRVEAAPGIRHVADDGADEHVACAEAVRDRGDDGWQVVGRVALDNRGDRDEPLPRGAEQHVGARVPREATQAVGVAVVWWRADGGDRGTLAAPSDRADALVQGVREGAAEGGIHDILLESTLPETVAVADRRVELSGGEGELPGEDHARFTLLSRREGLLDE